MSGKKKPSPSSPSGKSKASRGQPSSLRRINIDAIVRKIQIDAPITRSELTRATELSYPTVMKICDLLLEKKLIEWLPDSDRDGNRRGRPASYLQMSTSSAHVIAISFRPSYILAATAGLDGNTIRELRCPIPQTYPEILSSAHQLIKELRESNNSPTLGLGLAAPGLLEIGAHTQLTVSSNIPALAEHYITEDLGKLTNLPTVIVSTMRSLYNSSIIRGHAVKHEDFAILNYYAGMGLAVASNGVYMNGSQGMAGELGHTIVEPNGKPCGCGNRGCLETLATDLALAHSISHKLGRTVPVDEMVGLIRKSPSRFEEEIDRMLDYLAIAVGMTINIFNPEAILLYGRLLEIDDAFFDKLKKKTAATCLKQLASHCTLKKSKSRTIQGAALAIADELTRQLTPNIE
jgi:predicted NBD/HSP70 family sugar kinase